MSAIVILGRLVRCPRRKADRIVRPVIWICLLLSAAVLLSGCSSTKVRPHQAVTTEKLPQPERILVYDFATTPAELPPGSPLASSSTGPIPPEQENIGRQLGAEMAAQLVAAIREMGLPAEHATREAKPQINDLVISGYLVSIDEGSAAKRLTIGFRSGASELTTVVEVSQMTPQGLRFLGSGTATSGGSKGPGAAVGGATFAATGNPAGLIVSSGMKLYGEASGRAKVSGRARQTVKEIASRLEARFREQGWI